ncbi:hypothetical protein [Salinibacillus xinjiangensis]|uniref:Uncharacterized protein n=1 Tax=Salinibacillus xinjiangensis TaxID=1229268 RepID=A0A6G1XA08_9BACI|nr:hypothetical protein [Salinibacillus xinjiangensis]MRG87814.1 hypothetical protein [Salinibacillus xinjiangensis]
MNTRKNQNMPDFSSLDDRFIRDNSPSPRIVLKTNIDVQSNREANPYTSEKDTNDRLFNEFFNE